MASSPMTAALAARPPARRGNLKWHAPCAAALALCVAGQAGAESFAVNVKRLDKDLYRTDEGVHA